MVKILLFRATPRGNILQVEKHNANLQCDILHVKYTLELQAYRVAQKYFLEHDYEYLVLASDDLIVKPEHIEQITKLCEKDYAVISGLANVDETDLTETGRTNIILDKLPSKILKERKYHWLTRDKLPKENIFEVTFSGFALMAIRRDIIEKFNFVGAHWLEDPNNTFGSGFDLVFSYYCQENNIPIFVDKRIDMIHLRQSGEIQVGIKLPEVWLNEQQMASFEFELEPSM